MVYKKDTFKNLNLNVIKRINRLDLNKYHVSDFILSILNIKWEFDQGSMVLSNNCWIKYSQSVTMILAKFGWWSSTLSLKKMICSKIQNKKTGE